MKLNQQNFLKTATLLTALTLMGCGAFHDQSGIKIKNPDSTEKTNAAPSENSPSTPNTDEEAAPTVESPVTEIAVQENLPTTSKNSEINTSITENAQTGGPASIPSSSNNNTENSADGNSEQNSNPPNSSVTDIAEAPDSSDSTEPEIEIISGETKVIEKHHCTLKKKFILLNRAVLIIKNSTFERGVDIEAFESSSVKIEDSNVNFKNRRKNWKVHDHSKIHYQNKRESHHIYNSKVLSLF